MQSAQRRVPRVPRRALWEVGAVVAVLGLLVTGPGVIRRAQQGASADAQVALAAALHDLDDHTGGGLNKVVAVGTSNLRVTFRGHTEVAPFSGVSASSKDEAIAVGACTSCGNIAVALQLILVSPQTANVHITQKAYAVNVDCVHCTTAAITILYEVVVPHPEQTAKKVEPAIDHVDDQLDNMSGWSKRSLTSVVKNLNGVIQQFAKVAMQAALDGSMGTPGARPNGQAPHVAPPPANATLPGGRQLVPSLPGNPQVDIKVA
jgi:hypothetical protein